MANAYFFTPRMYLHLLVSRLDGRGMSMRWQRFFFACAICERLGRYYLKRIIV